MTIALDKLLLYIDQEYSGSDYTEITNWAVTAIAESATVLIYRDIKKYHSPLGRTLYYTWIKIVTANGVEVGKLFRRKEGYYSKWWCLPDGEYQIFIDEYEFAYRLSGSI